MAPDAVYAYDTATGTYQQRYALLPGEGAWAYSANGGVAGIASTSQSCQALRPPAALPINYVPPVTTPTPTTVPASISCFGPG